MKIYSKALTLLALITLFLTVTADFAAAHPGRTDKNGGHTCKTNCSKWGLKDGEYHLHVNGKIVRVDQKTKKPLTSTTTKKPVASNPLGIKANAVISNVKIVRVIDGDTVEVQFPDKNKTKGKIRLIGVNTPESTTKKEYFGKEASAYTKKRLLNKTVKLEFDAGTKDKYGRYLAYVWVGKEMFNETLVKNGYANVMTIQPNVKYQKKFVAGERYARQNGKGLWGKKK